MTFYRTVFAVAVFATFICGGSSINCFYCNSANNSACLDIQAYEGETRARIIPIVDCNIASEVPTNFFCRKISQTIFHPNREAEVRVTRGCGWVRDERAKDCYRADNRDHLETVCQCFTDYCNSAESADPASSVLLFLVFSAVLYFYR